ncbi:hypothetical protein A3H12_02850 [Candidatus Uhrbacteria bacterium RIFCSPLOWO2_12_FULL_47_9]|nr:MAG: hypothetical protein A3H12_02850 [Candidatus Uhrbacteria bacterium RIFCSPLOWO2_12_FULL_47_9]
MRKNFALFLSCLAALVVSACAEIDSVEQSPDASSDTSSWGEWTPHLVMQQVQDPNDPTATVWVGRDCTPTDDTDCNEVGLYTRLACDPDKKCRYYTASDKCAYTGLLGTSKTCTVETCIADSDCLTHTGGDCIVTFESMAGADGDPAGECFYPYAKCKAAEGTICEASGHVPCYDGSCACSATAKKSLKQTEVCDGKDNDCDGATDNGFNISDKCDGADSDMCLEGTFTCSTDMLSKTCSNEPSVDDVELCDDLDNDCDKSTDEDFPNKGKACDGSDADSCTNGSFVCTADKKGLECDEVGKNVVEICNGKDDTCDGKIDEGCDDDSDGYCDLAMAVTSGAACQSGGDCNDADKTVNPGAKELCNAVDDNCNSQTDDGIGKGEACSDGLGECKVDGMKICESNGSGAVVCSAVKKQAGTETCNGKDDTCDGKTDEGCDDDADGFCDNGLVFATGAACKKNDCNDDPSKDCAKMFEGASEVCNGADDDCNGQTDEGCDDDKDGYCDSLMEVSSGSSCKEPSGGGKDCNDKDALVNPDAKDVCNQVDDNCDGKVDVKSDGSAACDLKCPLVKSIVPGDWVEIDTATWGKQNAITSYWCGSSSSALKVVFAANEVFIAPQAPSGTKFTVQLPVGSGAVLGRLQNSCSPNEGTTSVTPVAKQGTCALLGITSVSGGVVGVDYIVLDAKANGKYKIKFTVSP